MGRCDVHCPSPGGADGAGLGVTTTLAWLTLGVFYAAWWWLTGAPHPMRRRPRRYARRVHAAARITVAGLLAAWFAWGAVVPVVAGSALTMATAAAVWLRIRMWRGERSAAALEERASRLAELRAAGQVPAIEWTPVDADVVPPRFVRSRHV